MLWSLPHCLYLPAVQTLIPFSLFTPYCFLSQRLHPCFGPLSPAFTIYFIQYDICLCAPSFLHHYLLTFPPPFLFLSNLYIPSQCHRSVSTLICDTDSSFYPFPPPNPLFSFPLCALFLTGSQSIAPPSSIFPFSYI